MTRDFVDEVVIVDFFKNKYHNRNIMNYYSHLLKINNQKICYSIKDNIDINSKIVR